MTRPLAALPPSLVTQLAIDALSGQGCYGLVSGLAREYDVSRHSVYAVEQRGCKALEAEFRVAQKTQEAD